jgi:hypothetical protein
MIKLQISNQSVLTFNRTVYVGFKFMKNNFWYHFQFSALMTRAHHWPQTLLGSFIKWQ